MSTFITNVLAATKQVSDEATKEYMSPFIQAMVLEGFNKMKPDCDSDTMVNPPSKTCLTGSPWVKDHVIPALVGSFENPLISVANDDNFHGAADLFPYHHPDLLTSCPLDT